VKVEVARPYELGPGHLDLWRRLQQRSATFASPFFCPEFALAVAAVRDDVFVGVLSEGDHVVGFFPFQRGPLRVGIPVGGGRSNYQGIVVDPAVSWDARSVVRACGLRQWRFDHLVAAQSEFAPYCTAEATSLLIDVSGGFAAYASQRRSSGSRVVPRIREKERRLAREAGPVSFVPHVSDRATLRLLMQWKSAQYRRTGEVDRFAVEWNVRLLESLHASEVNHNFSGVLSALVAGDAVVASVFGLRARQRLFYWFPGYATELARFSPGLILLLKLAEHAHDMGISIIDLGTDDADYKRRMANGHVDLREGVVSANRIYAALGTLRRGARDVVRRSPAAGPAKGAIQRARMLADRSSRRL
jgi:CelD/BcsL family acetyltransferase involved in cellulose biosynthesis